MVTALHPPAAAAHMLSQEIAGLIICIAGKGFAVVAGRAGIACFHALVGLQGVAVHSEEFEFSLEYWGGRHMKEFFGNIYAAAFRISEFTGGYTVYFRSTMYVTIIQSMPIAICYGILNKTVNVNLGINARYAFILLVFIIHGINYFYYSYNGFDAILDDFDKLTRKQQLRWKAIAIGSPLILMMIAYFLCT